MALIIMIPFAGDPMIDGLLTGYGWWDGVGPLSFGFPTAADDFADYLAQGLGEPIGFQQLPGPAEAAGSAMRATVQAFAQVAAFTALDLARLETTPGLADIRIATTTTPAVDPFYAYAYYPTSDWFLESGDVWFNTTDFIRVPLGSYAFAAVMHEIGHALGLKHGHAPELASFDVLPADLDSIEFSIMTYRSYVGGPAHPTILDGNAPQSFMMLDIAALQWMYGAKYAHPADHTVYRFDPDTGETFVNGVGLGRPQGAFGPVNVLFRTIWDGGGIDIYDFSAYGADFHMGIDLRPGGWTDVDRFGHAQAAFLGGGPNDGHARGQVANALLHRADPRSLIEHAIGGAGDDIIIGNQAANRLEGRGGDDILVGGAGRDVLDGGDGFDAADYGDSPGRVFVDLAIAGPQNTSGAGTDALIGIEALVGGRFNDVLGGDAGDNRLDGGAGNDVIEGRDGNDALVGGAGTDTAEYRSAAAGVRVSLALQGVPQDTLGAGIDTLSGFENLTGSDFADVLVGDGAGNILRGGAGDDILEGGEGNDLLDGGEGIDLAGYAGAPGPVKVYLNPASATGPAGLDRFVSIEGLLGSAFNDTLIGNPDANVLQGGDGADRLFGLAGDDILRGGPGDDVLYGGAGNDTADYSDATVTVRAILGIDATVGTISFGRDRYFDIENLAGGSARDFLTGDAQANTIWGKGGNDVIDGGAGDDTLFGGEGNDDLTGGAGADLIDLGPAAGNDIVRYRSAADSRAASMDRIIGFTASGPGFDRIAFGKAPDGLFAGVSPSAIALGSLLFLAGADDPAGLAVALGGLGPSGAGTLAMNQVEVASGALAGSYLVVNDLQAGFDPVADMLIGIRFATAAPLGAANLFLF